MKILHFSDIHEGDWPRFLGAFFDKRWIGAFNYMLRRRSHHHWSYLDRALEICRQEKPDLVLCTGDLTSCSDPHEFAKARQRLAPFVNSPDFDFLCIPGNHDRYTSLPAAQKACDDFLLWANKGRLQAGPTPQKIDFPGLRLILLDVCRPSWLNSAGRLSPENAALALDLARQGRELGLAPVSAQHYPLRNALGQPLAPRRALHGAEALAAGLDSGLLLASLCGHVHHPFFRTESSGSHEICAGSLTQFGQLARIEIDQGLLRHSWIDATHNLKTAAAQDLPRPLQGHKS